MKKKLLLLSLSLILPITSFSGSDFSESPIQINNRILATIKGKSITVLDLVKKMDMIFQKEFPHMTQSPEARFQFYDQNWRPLLQQMVDNELILADAEEKKVSVSSGEIREELDRVFGPNVVSTLDGLGLGYEEAKEMIQTDLTVQRMILFMARSKVMNGISPQELREAYQRRLDEFTRESQWIYRVLTIRGPNEGEAKEMANLAYLLLEKGECKLEEIPDTLKAQSENAALLSIRVSEEYRHNDDNLSESYKQVLQKLGEAGFSEPIAQVSRASGGTVYRIFSLDKHRPGGRIPFAHVQEEIQEGLTQERVAEETVVYLQDLRDRFGLDQATLAEKIPSDFKPFVL